MTQNVKQILTLKATALSPDSLIEFYQNITGKTLKVLFLNNISDNETIESLFNEGCFVLFIPTLNDTNGHFISMFRSRLGIYWFDSYGNTPKELIKIIEDMGHVTLKRTLFEIIVKSRENFYSNKIIYQSRGEHVADCGRYAITNCIWYEDAVKHNKLYDLNTFNDLLIEYMKTVNLADYDDAITMLTKELK